MQLVELLGTAGFTMWAQQRLQGEGAETLKKGWEEFRARIDENDRYRVIVRNYIEHEIDNPYRSALQQAYVAAGTAGEYGYAERIEQAYVLVYRIFEDTERGNEEERKQTRKREFEDLGRAAMETDKTLFNAMLDFYEQRGARTYLRIAKQLGIDAWQFLGGPLTAIAEAIGGEGALEQAKAYLQDPKRWGPDFLARRKEVLEWAEAKTVRMQEAYAWSIHDAAERPPDHWIRRVVIMIALTMGGALVFGLLYGLTE